MHIKIDKRKIEILIYVLTGIVILSVPFFDHPYGSPDYLKRSLLDSKRIILFILLFFINIELLIPKLLLKKEYSVYFISVFLILFLFLVISYVINYLPSFHIMGRPHFPNRPLPPPPKRISIWLFHQIVINILVIGLGTGLKMSRQWFYNEKQKKELEKENLKSELAFLKTQISPHFFLNTLNNIHALTEINVKDAQKAIIELSKMMRYLLYESERGNTTLQKEIEFLRNYIELMKRRIADGVVIDVKIPDKVKDISLPPLLFISFIENAFKYGISYKNKSFIKIELMLISNKELLFTCANSKIKSEQVETPDSGIGLKNIKKRLDLLFNDTYSLLIDDTENEYKIILKIPVHAN